MMAYVQSMNDDMGRLEIKLLEEMLLVLNIGKVIYKGRKRSLRRLFFTKGRS